MLVVSDDFPLMILRTLELGFLLLVHAGPAAKVGVNTQVLERPLLAA